MRIIAGQWRGRSLVAPRGITTRPTSDRVREALFSSIEARLGSLVGARVLDAFAGSGALGLEAASRGAVHVTLVECERSAQEAIRTNIRTLDAPATLVRGDALSERIMARLAGPYSLILLDPPYRIDKSEVRALMERLRTNGQLADGAMIVWEHDAASAAAWPAFVEPGVTRTYGSTATDIGIVHGEGEQR